MHICVLCCLQCIELGHILYVGLKAQLLNTYKTSQKPYHSALYVIKGVANYDILQFSLRKTAKVILVRSFGELIHG